MQDYSTAITDMENIALEKRKALGKEKKLRTVTVYYKEGNITKKVFQNNLAGPEVKALMSIYTDGMTLPVSPGVWRVVAPWDIVDFIIERQNQFND